jgi:hypothetical protein
LEAVFYAGCAEVTKKRLGKRFLKATNSNIVGNGDFYEVSAKVLQGEQKKKMRCNYS